MGGLCQCLSKNERKEQLNGEQDGLQIQPLEMKLKPMEDGSDIEKLMDSYTREVQKLELDTDDVSKPLIVLFGAYVTKIREVLFKTTQKERRAALELSDWKKARTTYKQIILGMFIELQKHVDELQQITLRALKIDQDQLFFWINTGNIKEKELKDLEISISQRSTQIKAEAFQWGEKKRDKKSGLAQKDNQDMLLLEESKCKEIQEYIEFIEREQYYFDHKPWDKEQAVKSSHHQKHNNSLGENDQSGSLTTRDNTQKSMEIEEICEISMNGFEIEDRVQFKYDVSMEQFKQSYSLYYLDGKQV